MLRLRQILTLNRMSSPFRQLVKRSLCNKSGDDDGKKYVEEIKEKELVSSEEKEKRIRITPTEPTVYDYKPVKELFRKEYEAIKEGKDPEDIILVPRETDCAIIGGGAIGLATAYFMQLNSGEEMNVTVIEKDPTYTQCSSVLSVGGIRQQFSLKENIEMSLFAADFIRNIKENLSVMDLDPPDVQFNPQGYLLLASERGTEIMMTNHQTQVESGAKVILMSPPELKERFPWLNVDDIALGSYGLENEGWFDPWLLLGALKAKCINMGVKFVKGEVVDFSLTEGRPMPTWDGKVKKREMLDSLMVRTEPNVVYPCKFAFCVNAAGAWSGKVAELAGIGVGDGPLSVPLPVQPRKRYVFVVHCPDGPGLDTPLVVDNCGVYMRREGLGGHYICGISPCDDTDDVEPEEVFRTHVLPELAHRIPVFHDCTVKSAWAGYYDYNYFDENLIIGNHPMHRNFYFASGCSGHGIQQALAIGRGISEVILKDGYVSIDLSRFQFDRIMDDKPVFETNCV